MKKVMMGVLAAAFVAGTVFIATAASGNTAQAIEVYPNRVNLVINGRTSGINTFLFNDRTYIPIRDLVESLGGRITYDPTNNTAYVDSLSIAVTPAASAPSSQTDTSTTAVTSTGAAVVAPGSGYANYYPSNSYYYRPYQPTVTPMPTAAVTVAPTDSTSTAGTGTGTTTAGTGTGTTTAGTGSTDTATTDTSNTSTTTAGTDSSTSTTTTGTDSTSTTEAQPVIAINIASPLTKLKYYEGEKLDLTGLKVKLTYEDKTSEDVDYTDFAAKGITMKYGDTDDPVAHEDVLSKTAHHDKVITIFHGDLTPLETRPLSVSDTVSNIVVKHGFNKTYYYEGEKIDLTGLEATLKYSNDAEENVAYTDFKAKKIVMTYTTGSQAVNLDTILTNTTHTDETITLTHGTHSTSTLYRDRLNVSNTVKTIEILNQPKLNYEYGEKLDLLPLELKLTYDNDNDVVETLMYNEKIFTDRSISLNYNDNNGGAGTPATPNERMKIKDHHGKKIIVTMAGITDETGELTVTGTPVSLAISNPPNLVTYDNTSDYILKLAGLTVKLTYDYSGGSGTDEVPFEEFATYPIPIEITYTGTANTKGEPIAEGATLDPDTHNNKFIAVTAPVTTGTGFATVTKGTTKLSVTA
ncbi:MAG: copper amine oxidase N-terminal domain-containing protein [Clostridiales bacterium]|nr:copper amine oxidase N-terminal domain-containing protein [Clostridiales bacterium]